MPGEKWFPPQRDGEQLEVTHVENDVVFYVITRPAGGSSTGRMNVKAWDRAGPRSWGWVREVAS